MKPVSEHIIKSTGKKLLLAVPETNADFEKYFTLRYEVLRKPWNQPKGSEQDEGDKTSQHVCLLFNDEVIGVCRLQLNSASEAQIRYMGVHSNYQGMHLGDIMLAYFEVRAKELGIKTIFLQAREKAVSFYKRNGYQMIEKTFLLFDQIQHYSMQKNLRQES